MIYNGDIGEDPEEYEFEPMPESEPVPEKVPAQPVKEPTKEPVPA